MTPPKVHLAPPLECIDQDVLLTLLGSVGSGHWAGPLQGGVGMAQDFHQGGREGGSESKEAFAAPGQIQEVLTRDEDSPG